MLRQASKQASKQDKPRRVHCLFEQSGTFKNEFKKLGIDAYDYDIQNEFNQTDYIVDLFQAIEDAYDGKPSIFDDFTEDDLIMAFFPCTRFEAQILLSFRGDAFQDKYLTDIQKLEKDLKLHKQLHLNYSLITKLVIVSIKRNLPMVFENPYTEQHYLTRYWCMKPSLIDKDRTKRGDYYKKPTQYWFFNCEPKANLIMESFEYVKTATIDNPIKGVGRTTARSMIHPQYANRFIREFILGEEFIQKQENEQLNLFKE